MKMWELATGLMTSLTNEEDDLLLKLMDDEKVILSERESIVAQNLLQKNALVRHESDGSFIFRVNYAVDSWRD